ncbi:MAG: deoxynucleoside kinase [Bacteroidales bacterium]|nr:deoxynucleoside kinase [Bacteroidales bacterium]
MHIGIAGNIGAGKTTLTRMLSEHYGWIPKYESVTYNPYLEDYYKDIKRWSYNLETYFLAQRFRDLVEISKSDDIIIQDRTLMEGVNIFVANNVAMDNLSQRDYETYLQLYNLMMSMVREPDLLIYLRSSIEGIVRKIQKRGRDYEQGLSVEYLGNLNRLYEQWISNYKGRIIIFDVDNLDYENNPQDFALITDRLDSELFGLFRQ